MKILKKTCLQRHDVHVSYSAENNFKHQHTLCLMELQRITDMPSALISYTGTYLTLNDVASYLRCNKRIFVACKSHPNVYNDLFSNSRWFQSFVWNYGVNNRQNQMNKLNRFRMANNVSFFVNDYIQNNFGQTAHGLPWMQLKIICLHFHPMRALTTHVITNKMNHLSNYLNIAQIEQLALVWRGLYQQGGVPKAITRARFDNLLRMATANRGLHSLILGLLSLIFKL